MRLSNWTEVTQLIRGEGTIRPKGMWAQHNILLMSILHRCFVTFRYLDQELREDQRFSCSYGAI